MAEEKDNGGHSYLMKKDALEGLDLMPTYLKISQILLLRHDEFLDLIAKFNETLKSFTDDEPDYIEFSIESETDSTMLWKYFVRIHCSRIARADRRTSETIVFSLNQFLSVHQSLTQQMSALEHSASNTLSNSATTTTTTTTLYNRSFSQGRLSFPAFDGDECCICMEHQSTLVLPCTHKLCEDCLQRWTNETSAMGRHTCPICRQDINIDSDFLLTEAPESDAVRKALKESILGIVKDGKKCE